MNLCARAFLIFAVLALCLYVAPGAFAERFMWGDLGTAPAIACDGKVGGQDAVVILRWYAGLTEARVKARAREKVKARVKARAREKVKARVKAKDRRRYSWPGRPPALPP